MIPSPVTQFLTSRRHWVGSVLALVGPVLLGLGVIHSGWFLITLGLYVAGVLLTPPERSAPLLLTTAPASLSHELEQWRHRLANEAQDLPTEAQARLQALVKRLTETLKLQGDRLDSLPQVNPLRLIVAQDLPTLIDGYLKLPRDFRQTHALSNGQTATQLLIEQVTGLCDEAERLLVAIAQNDAQALTQLSDYLSARRKPVAQWDHTGQLIQPSSFISPPANTTRQWDECVTEASDPFSRIDDE